MINGAALAAWLARHAADFRLSVRVTAAGLLTYALAEGLHLAQGYWAVFTAVIVIQASVGGSLKATLDRLTGTLGGAVYGAAVGLLVPHSDRPGMAVALAVALAPLAFLAAVNSSFRIAPVTAVIVLLGTTSQQAGLLGGAIDRVFEIGLGCVAGFAVSFVVLPARAHGLVAKSAGRSFALLAELFAALIARLLGEGDRATVQQVQDRIRAALTRLETIAKEAERERTLRLTDDPDPEPLVRTTRRVRSDLVIVARAASSPLPEAVRAQLAPSLTAIGAAVASLLREVGRALAERRAPPALDAAATALETFNGAMADVRRMGLTRDLPTEDAGRIFALGFAFEELRRDLDDLASRTGE
ncbi:MAG TPA: FUSC family protein, partial [Stellaceae bacterium]|nr:FUSC family protein [Stellaceae bacterium]